MRTVSKTLVSEIVNLIMDKHYGLNINQKINLKSWLALEKGEGTLMERAKSFKYVKSYSLQPCFSWQQRYFSYYSPWLNVKRSAKSCCPPHIRRQIKKDELLMMED